MSLFSKYRGNFKGLLFYVSYRFVNKLTTGKIGHILLCPLWITYRYYFNWILGIDISEYTKIGKGLIVWHGVGLIVHPNTIIGDNVVLRHNTTIGAKDDGLAPVIEDNVDVGTGVVIIGNITIGHDSKIGAGAIVTKTCAPHSILVGNPAKNIAN